MTYRAQGLERTFVCRACEGVGVGPWGGGEVACATCGASHLLADREALRGPGARRAPTDDPARLAQLHRQTSALRAPSPTLVTVLGGPSLRPEREREVHAIWRNLRERAEARDVVASEDLAMLTSMMVQRTTMETRLAVALAESALDAVCLSRHRQEMLGWLARTSVATGDLARAEVLVDLMEATPDDLESESELRTALALCATAVGDARRVLDLLGTGQSAIPVARSLGDLATVLRAHALEASGDVEAAVRVLGELSTPHVLGAACARYAASSLCAVSGPRFVSERRARAARAASKSAGSLGYLFWLFAVLGLGSVGLGVAVLTGHLESDDSWSYVVIGLPILLLGAGGVVVTRAASRHAGWLQREGLSLEARVLDVATTGASVGDVPVMRLSLEVTGPRGAYLAACSTVISEVGAAALVGATVRVRAAPQRLTDVALEI